jgi:hypothetical protein
VAQKSQGIRGFMTLEKLILEILQHWRDRKPIAPLQRSRLSERAAHHGLTDVAAVLSSDAQYALLSARETQLHMARHPTLLHDLGNGELWLLHERSNQFSLAALYALASLSCHERGDA